MTCDEIQNRLLALADPARVPQDLRAHLAQCAPCRSVLAAVVEVESLVARLPIPDSAPAQAAFLDRFAEPSSIIALAPVPYRPRQTRWPAYAASLAAGICLVVGGWYVTRPGPAPVARIGPRHELLQKEVRHVVALTKAESPADRMLIWADVAADFQQEMKDLYQVADEYDLDILTQMFGRAIDEGVLAQARKIPPFFPPVERRNKLTATAVKLAATEVAAEALVLTARPSAKPYLERIVRTAKLGREKLQKLTDGEKG
jgi:hypothetical protein